MAHELVFRINELTGANEALMMYVKEAGWHGLGTRFEKLPSLEEVKQVCGFDRTVTLHDVECNGMKLADCKGVFDTAGRYLGTVGPDYTVHQDGDLCALAQGYIDTGLCEVDTAGMILGGSRIWISLKIKDSEAEIAPGDSIKSNLFMGQGHDMTLSVVQGLTDIRTVCNNTMGMVLREDGHKRTKHQGAVQVSASKAQKQLLDLLERRKSRVEAYRMLAQTPVDSKGVDEFILALTGKEDTGRDGGPGTRIKLKFLAGIGNKGENWWHLLNAVTEDVTHGLGNKRSEDGFGSREGRALNKMFFGTGAKMNADAFRIAVNLANGKAPSNRLALALTA